MSIEPKPNEIQPPLETVRYKTVNVRKALFLLVIFVAGFGGGFFVGRQSAPADSSIAGAHHMTQIDEVNPPAGYQIPAMPGDAGPQLLAAGAIDLPRFVDVYQGAGSPLTEDQLAILTKGSSSSITITQANAYFLLNFFWALGLTNQNPVLTKGIMQERGKDQVGNFASTGGWTLGTKPPMELYASTMIVALTDEQQARLLNVASTVYRPCCDNPTHLPDCNHGMAMLGLLELMASQNASEAEMFKAAKYVNAYWYPQQMVEIATYFNANQNVDFAQADAQQIVSQQYSSASGFQGVHQWLGSNGLLEQAPNNGGSCGV